MRNEHQVDVTGRVSIEIYSIEGKHSIAEKSDFMKRVTEAVARILGCSTEEVVVRIVEDKPENVSRAGIPLTRRR